MQRRDFVKGIAAASAAATTALAQKTAQKQPITPEPSNATQSQGTMAVSPDKASSPQAQTQTMRSMEFHTPRIPVSVPDVAATTDARFFNPQQYATLEKLCAVLMPPLNGFPGAIAAGVPEFLDFHVGSSPADRKKMYAGGLDRLNADAQKHFHCPFSQVSEEQASTIIHPLLETWINDHPPKDPYKRFIAISHREIRTVTVNSEAWNQAVVASGERASNSAPYWAPIDPLTRLYADPVRA